MKHKIELLSGVGDFASVIASVKAGCDAVYFGVKGLNMRDFGTNFTQEKMKDVVKFCHKNKVKAYLTLNTIVYDRELMVMKKILKLAKKNKIDAVICSDLSVLQEAKKLKIPIHISTQMSVSNSVSADFFKKLGAERIVLARELSLKQIEEIKRKSKIDIEIFCHGSMCISVSGRCFLSLYFHDKSANRGKCTQPCRRRWVLQGEEDSGKEVDIYDNTILSSKDLCTIPFFEKIVALKPKAVKIEGRTKGPEYVYTTTSVYRKALDLAEKKKLTESEKKKLLEELQKVFNRGFTQGFYFRTPDYNDITQTQISAKTEKLVQIGKAKNFYVKHNVVEFNAIENFSVGDILLVKGDTTFFKQKIESVEVDRKKVNKVKKGEDVGLKVNERIRKGDNLFIVK